MKNNIRNQTDLKNAIQLLEFEQENEWILLKHAARETYEKLSPLNIVRNSVKELVQIPDLKDKLIATVIGMGVGYISKKLLVNDTDGPLKKIAGALLQSGVSAEIAQKPEMIKWVMKLLSGVFTPANKTE